jgi:hypothetical protein
MSEVDDAVGPLDDLLATGVQPWAGSNSGSGSVFQRVAGVDAPPDGTQGPDNGEVITSSGAARTTTPAGAPWDQTALDAYFPSIQGALDSRPAHGRGRPVPAAVARVPSTPRSRASDPPRLP